MSTQKILLIGPHLGRLDHLAQTYRDIPALVEQTQVDSAEQIRAIRPSATLGGIVFDCDLPAGASADWLRALSAIAIGVPVLVIATEAHRLVFEQNCGADFEFLPRWQGETARCASCRLNGAISSCRARAPDRRQMERRVSTLTALARTDALTGLANRRAFEDLFDKRRGILDRRGDASVLMIDLDRFKRINDDFGHAAGDCVLRTIGKTLLSATEHCGTAYRWGGEEFVVLLQNLVSADAVEWAEQLRLRIAGLDVSMGPSPTTPLRITVSIGVVSCRRAALTMDVVADADEAMYQAKQQGRDRVVSIRQKRLSESRRVATFRRDFDGLVKTLR